MMERRFGSAEDIVAGALRRAEGRVARYFAFAREWPDLMVLLGEDVLLCQHLQGKVTG